MNIYIYNTYITLLYLGRMNKYIETLYIGKYPKKNLD